MSTVERLLEEAKIQLAETGSPETEALMLLGHASGQSRAALLARPDSTVDQSAVRRFKAMVVRRQIGVPVAYLTGLREFWSLPLFVNESVLIPRHETELVVERALFAFARRVPRCVLDLGSGCGAIALALASEWPESKVVGIDLSHQAIETAKDNQRRLSLSNVTFRQGDWYEPVERRRFDLIVANPPYIAHQDPYLNQGDLRYEPRTALVASQHGYGALQLIIASATQYLNPKGWLVVEHGFEQAAHIRVMLVEAGLDRVSTHRDLAGKDRVSEGRLA